MALSTGTRFGPYEILALVGVGGMGEVYRACDPATGRVVAIKVLPRVYCSDAERLAQLEREARLMASLHHPNIAAIHRLERAGVEPHLVLEFVPGRTLAARLTQGPLPMREAVGFCAQVAAALEAAHARGVIHRDLKPGNIMLTDSGLVKVLDFGLAKGDGPARPPASTHLRPHRDAAVPSAISGTIAYMSPEQARGQTLDERADLWSCGCVLYECLAGRRAFAGETIGVVFARVLADEPDWKWLGPSIPPRLVNIVQWCLRKKAAERPPDAATLRRELLALAAHSVR